MSIAKAFFVREIVRLRRNIALLQRGLSGSDPTDPHYAGQRQLLDNENRCREMLLDLAEHAGDLATLRARIRVHYLMARRVHDRSRLQHPLNGHGPCDEWWETLGKMQYLCYLQCSLDKLLHEYSPEEVKLEIRKAVSAKDLSGTLERSEILRAIASAEGSAADRAHLVRDDVFPTNGHDRG